LSIFIGCSHELCSAIGRRANSHEALMDAIEAICRYGFRFWFGVTEAGLSPVLLPAGVCLRRTDLVLSFPLRRRNTEFLQVASQNGIAAIAQAAVNVCRSQDPAAMARTATRPTERTLIKMMLQVCCTHRGPLVTAGRERQSAIIVIVCLPSAQLHSVPAQNMSNPHLAVYLASFWLTADVLTTGGHESWTRVSCCLLHIFATKFESPSAIAGHANAGQRGAEHPRHLGSAQA
jgi:hypothetical protein